MIQERETDQCWRRRRRGRWRAALRRNWSLRPGRAMSAGRSPAASRIGSGRDVEQRRARGEVAADQRRLRGARRWLRGVSPSISPVGRRASSDLAQSSVVSCHPAFGLAGRAARMSGSVASEGAAQRSSGSVRPVAAAVGDDRRDRQCGHRARRRLSSSLEGRASGEGGLEARQDQRQLQRGRPLPAPVLGGRARRLARVEIGGSVAVAARRVPSVRPEMPSSRATRARRCPCAGHRGSARSRRHAAVEAPAAIGVDLRGQRAAARASSGERSTGCALAAWRFQRGLRSSASREFGDPGIGFASHLPWPTRGWRRALRSGSAERPAIGSTDELPPDGSRPPAASR